MRGGIDAQRRRGRACYRTLLEDGVEALRRRDAW
jgi:hypothetical protein